MNYTKDIEKAMIISYKAYEGEMDENGVPIFFHSMRFADAIWDETTIIVALLNDLIENAGYIPEDFTEMGFSEAVIDALKLLEYDVDTSYTEYIKQLAENPFSRAVKIEQLDELIYDLQIIYSDDVKEKIIKYSDAKD